MICFFILEDITIGIQSQKDWETPGGISPIAECMFMGQKLDIGAAVVTHTLSGSSPIIRQNVESWFVSALPGEDPRLVCNMFGADFDQAEKLRTLRRGEFMCLNPVLWPKPVIASFSPPHIPGVCSESIRRSTVEKFNKKVNAASPAPLEVFKPKVATKTKDGGAATPHTELPSSQIEMLIVIVTGPPKPATKVYEQMGLGRTQCRRIVKALESIAAVLIHRFSTGRIGGQLCFFEITEYGWQILELKGISRPKSLTNGGFEHELAARLIEAKARVEGFGVEFEIDIGGLRLDVALINRKTGQRAYYNIGISNPAHEVDSLEKFFSLPASQNSSFTLVARDSTFAKQVKKILKEKKVDANIMKKVEIKLIANFVNV